MVKILVPMDNSSGSIAALKQAAALASGPDTSLILLYVVESGSLGLSHENAVEQSPQRLEVERLLKSFSESSPPISFAEYKVEGVPVASILAVAQEERVDLIVIGTTGRTGVKRFVLGSVAEEVIRRAPCPVLTVRARTTEKIGANAPVVFEKWTSLGTSGLEPSPLQPLGSDSTQTNAAIDLVSRAIAARASDIHIDPFGDEFTVRFRIDGRMSNYCRLSNDVGRSLIMQLRVTSNLDIADPFHPKHGRLMLPDSMSECEVRITMVPVIVGEAVSLRILGRSRFVRAMDQLGLSSDSQSRIDHILRHGEGIVLVTGPAGSGKTTTLCSMLQAIDDGSRNIVTIEDPVEYNIPSFRQIPVDAKHGITMTNGLKTLLRLDPDVVLIGEIRDADAADTAMRAASSGKYVFTTLHTRDVASTITAIRDLHIDNRSLAGNLAGIISQRLVRRLCRECCSSAPPTDSEAKFFIDNGRTPPTEISHPVGCEHCRGTGFRDRIGIFEVVMSDDEIVGAIEVGKPEAELRQIIHSRGVPTLMQDVLQKVAEGFVCLEEAKAMYAMDLAKGSM